MLGVCELTDKFPMGILMKKGLTLRTAQQHGQRYIPQSFDDVAQGDLDPSILITHDLPLDEGCAPTTCSRTRPTAASASR